MSRQVLRHNTLLARAGVSLAQAQKRMRHATPALTANVYTQLEMDDPQETVARLDVGPKKSKREPQRRRKAGSSKVRRA